MKVLSVLQPWATLIVMGAKKIETRSWNTKYRGPLLIHASKGKKAGGWELATVANQFGIKKPAFDDLPFGAIIGQANIIETASTNNLLPNLFNEPTITGDSKYSFLHLTEQEKAFGDYSPDRYGWLLADPFQFETPIPVKGNLGLWEYDYKSVETVKPL